MSPSGPQRRTDPWPPLRYPLQFPKHTSHTWPSTWMLPLPGLPSLLFSAHGNHLPFWSDLFATTFYCTHFTKPATLRCELLLFAERTDEQQGAVQRKQAAILRATPNPQPSANTHECSLTSPQSAHEEGVLGGDSTSPLSSCRVPGTGYHSPHRKRSLLEPLLGLEGAVQTSGLQDFRQGLVKGLTLERGKIWMEKGHPKWRASATTA